MRSPVYLTLTSLSAVAHATTCKWTIPDSIPLIGGTKLGCGDITNESGQAFFISTDWGSSDSSSFDEGKRYIAKQLLKPGEASRKYTEDADGYLAPAGCVMEGILFDIAGTAMPFTHDRKGKTGLWVK
ncbi:hypothetical protein HDV00_003895, partial [Rhizophlyctis rosea]